MESEDSRDSCACKCLSIPGMCFKPSDEELVGYFLKEKIEGRPLMCNHYMAEFKIYDDYLMPWDIIKDDDRHWITSSNDSSSPTVIKKTIYVFTELCKKRSRVMRRSGGGSWTNQHTQVVKNFAGDDHIGYNKLLTFYRDSDDKAKKKKKIVDEDHGHWIMHEYSLLGIDNYVLCKIIKEVETSSQVSMCSTEEVNLLVDSNIRRDVEDMNMVLGDRRQLRGKVHNDQPLDESGADWDYNGWKAELDKELDLVIIDDTSAEVIQKLPILATVDDAPLVVPIDVDDDEDTIIIENSQITNAAVEISDDTSDAVVQNLPINVDDQAERVHNNIPDDLSMFLNYIVEMDSIVAVQESPVAACEDREGSTIINQILNDFSNFEQVESALAVEQTNTTQDVLDVRQDFPFYDTLNLGGAETNQQTSTIFEEQARKRIRNNVDNYQKFSSRKKQRYLQL